jgi:hypothetical protein
MNNNMSNEIIIKYCSVCENKISEEKYNYCVLYCSNWNPTPKCDSCLKDNYCWKKFKLNKTVCSCSYCREIICDCDFCKDC